MDFHILIFRTFLWKNLLKKAENKNLCLAGHSIISNLNAIVSIVLIMIRSISKGQVNGAFRQAASEFYM